MALIVKATINGIVHTLNYNASTNKYEATVNAPNASSYRENADHYFPVTVTATDEAGNSTSVNDTHSTLGESLKLYVHEKVAPIITEVSPTDGANISTANPTISFKLLDTNEGMESGYSGIDLSTLKLTVKGKLIDASAIKTTEISGGYQCEYTPTTALDEGNCSYSIVVSDFDENTSNTISKTFKIDTKPPTLNVKDFDSEYTNENIVFVSGTTSDYASSPVTITIKVGSTDQGTVAVNAADGSFSHPVRLEDGLNTITVIATDTTGKQSLVTKTIILKTNAPVFKTVTISPNHIDAGKTYTITVEVE